MKELNDELVYARGVIASLEEKDRKQVLEALEKIDSVLKSYPDAIGIIALTYISILKQSEL